MPGITLTKTIAAKPEQVFAVFSDLPRAAERIRAIKRIQMLTPGPVGMGTRWKETRVMFGKEATEEMTITAFEPGRHYRAEAENSGVRYIASFQFIPEGQGTRVEMSFEGKPMTMMAKLASPLGAMMMGSVKKAMEEDIEDLKGFIEAEGLD